MKQTQVLKHARDKPRTSAQFKKKNHGTGGDTQMIQCLAIGKKAPNLKIPGKPQKILNQSCPFLMLEMI